MVALSPITVRDNTTTGSSRFVVDDLGCSSIDCHSPVHNCAPTTATAISCNENINTTNHSNNTTGRSSSKWKGGGHRRRQQAATTKSASKTKQQTPLIKKEATGHQVGMKHLDIDIDLDDDQKSSFSEHSWTGSELDLDQIAPVTPVAAIRRNTNGHGRTGEVEDDVGGGSRSGRSSVIISSMHTHLNGMTTTLLDSNNKQKQQREEEDSRAEQFRVERFLDEADIDINQINWSESDLDEDVNVKDDTDISNDTLLLSHLPKQPPENNHTLAVAATAPNCANNNADVDVDINWSGSDLDDFAPDINNSCHMKEDDFAPDMNNSCHINTTTISKQTMLMTENMSHTHDTNDVDQRDDDDDRHSRNGDENNQRQSNSNSNGNSCHTVREAAAVEEQQQQQVRQQIMDVVKQQHPVEQQVSILDENDGNSTNCSVSIGTDIAKLWIVKHGDEKEQVLPEHITKGDSDSTTTDIEELWNDDDDTRSTSVVSVTKRTTNTTIAQATMHSVRTTARTNVTTRTPAVIHENEESLFLEQLEETPININKTIEQQQEYEEDLLDVFFESVHDRICHERSTRSERSHLGCLSDEEEEEEQNNDALLVCQLLLDPILNHLEKYDPLFEELEHLACPEEDDKTAISDVAAAAAAAAADGRDDDDCFSTMVVCGKGTTPTAASIIKNRSSMTDTDPPPPPPPPGPQPPRSRTRPIKNYAAATLTQLLDRVEQFDPYFEQCTEKIEELFAKKKGNSDHNTATNNNTDEEQLKTTPTTDSTRIVRQHNESMKKNISINIDVLDKAFESAELLLQEQKEKARRNEETTGKGTTTATASTSQALERIEVLLQKQKEHWFAARLNWKLRHSLLKEKLTGTVNGIVENAVTVANKCATTTGTTTTTDIPSVDSITDDLIPTTVDSSTSCIDDDDDESPDNKNDQQPMKVDKTRKKNKKKKSSISSSTTQEAPKMTVITPSEQQPKTLEEETVSSPTDEIEYDQSQSHSRSHGSSYNSFSPHHLRSNTNTNTNTSTSRTRGLSYNSSSPHHLRSNTNTNTSTSRTGISISISITTEMMRRE